MKKITWPVVVIGALLVILTYTPFMFVLANSLKSDTQIASHPLSVMFTFHAKNYSEALNGMLPYLVNTVIVGVVSVLIAIPFAGAAGYVFATTRFKGKKIVFYAYLGLLMIPWTLTLIPLFLEMKNFHLYNTWWALVMPYAAGSQPLLVYLFRVFFEGIPEELFECARIDGASEIRILLRIVTPLSVPIIMTGIVIMFFNIWGDYLWPTVVLPNYHLLTVSAGLQVFLGSFGATGHGAGAMFASYVITMLPIIIFLLASMRYFVNGITAGSVKG